MDCSDVRHFIAAARHPLDKIRNVLVEQYYIADTRERARATGLLHATDGEPSRCRARVGRGRCRKRVPQVAINQYCWKHQCCNTLETQSDRSIEKALRGEQPEDGDTYEGGWDAHRRYHGEGTLMRPRAARCHYMEPGCVTSVRYQGNFVHGRFHGTGGLSVTWSSVGISSPPCYYNYTGQFFLGNEHGEGKMATGLEDETAYYAGEFAAGKPHGRGAWSNHWFFPNDARYVGRSKHGRPHGLGILASQLCS